MDSPFALSPLPSTSCVWNTLKSAVYVPGELERVVGRDPLDRGRVAGRADIQPQAEGVDAGGESDVQLGERPADDGEPRVGGGAQASP